MTRLTLHELTEIMGGTVHGANSPGSAHVSSISVRSRQIQHETAFAALQGSNTDGHRFVADAFQNGAVAAVVARSWHKTNQESFTGPLIVVDDPLEAVQRLAAWWRRQFTGRVIAITGSNGKTLVKDCLLHILSRRSYCSASPGSFNSQLGVPLSVLRIGKEANCAILEAGVSVPGEMTRLEEIIRPDFGILTNIGWAHISSFGDQEKIADEKAKLFARIPPEGWVLVPAGDPLIDRITDSLTCAVHRFGEPSEVLPYITNRNQSPDGITVAMRFPGGGEITVSVATPSQDIVTDVHIAVCAAYLLGVPVDMIASALAGYTPPGTRMEIWKSPSGVTLINDSNSSEPLSLQAALRALETASSSHGRRIFVFGGMEERGASERDEYTQAGELAARHGVNELLLVGGDSLLITQTAFEQHAPHGLVKRFEGISGVREHLLSSLGWGDAVLLAGLHNASIGRMAGDLIEAMAPNRFFVDLEALAENVSRFRRLVGPDARILAMVKALAYGSDSTRLVLGLQKTGVDLLGVSSADEGRALREAGVNLPILVMMCTPDEVDKLTHYGLTPVAYSLEIADRLFEAARAQHCDLNVHIEIDTGMSRLGVSPDEAVSLAQRIRDTEGLHLEGLMTHFASADDPAEDPFTRVQIERFQDVCNQVERLGFTSLIRHACATSGTVRFPEARFDMVRIGLGLYGTYPSPAVARGLDLVLAVGLVSRIVKIQSLKIGDRIGYNGTYTVERDGFKAAVVPIGYHDGVPVSLSNRGYVLVNGRKAEVRGRVSMDSLIVDVTDISEAEVGADVLIYGSHGGDAIRPEESAAAAGTIVYELLARLGPRVQRVFLGS